MDVALKARGPSRRSFAEGVQGELELALVRLGLVVHAEAEVGGAAQQVARAEQAMQREGPLVLERAQAVEAGEDVLAGGGRLAAGLAGGQGPDHRALLEAVQLAIDRAQVRDLGVDEVDERGEGRELSIELGRRAADLGLGVHDEAQAHERQIQLAMHALGE